MKVEPLRVIILGATSAIAEAVARLYAAEGAALLLAGRNADRLHAISQDLTARYARRDRGPRSGATRNLGRGTAAHGRFARDH